MNIPDEHHAQRARVRALCKKLQLPDNDPVPSDSLDSVERTLRYLATIDEEPKSTFARQLITDGVTLPPPDSLRPRLDPPTMTRSSTSSLPSSPSIPAPASSRSPESIRVT